MFSRIYFVLASLRFSLCWLVVALFYLPSTACSPVFPIQDGLLHSLCSCTRKERIVQNELMKSVLGSKKSLPEILEFIVERTARVLELAVSQTQSGAMDMGEKMKNPRREGNERRRKNPRREENELSEEDEASKERRENRRALLERGKRERPVLGRSKKKSERRKEKRSGARTNWEDARRANLVDHAELACWLRSKNFEDEENLKVTVTPVRSR